MTTFNEMTKVQYQLVFDIKKLSYQEIMDMPEKSEYDMAEKGYQLIVGKVCNKDLSISINVELKDTNPVILPNKELSNIFEKYKVKHNSFSSLYDFTILPNGKIIDDHEEGLGLKKDSLLSGENYSYETVEDHIIDYLNIEYTYDQSEGEVFKKEYLEYSGEFTINKNKIRYWRYQKVSIYYLVRVENVSNGYEMSVIVSDI